MSTDEKHPVRNGILIGVGVGVGVPVIFYVASIIPGLVKWFIAHISAVWSYCSGQTTVRRWLIIFLLIGCSPAVFLLVRALNKLRGPRRSQYREDRFFEVVWRWGYSFGSPGDLWCFCPTCDTKLVYSETDYPDTVVFTCERCDVPLHKVGGDREYALAQIYRQIDRKLRNGEWRKDMQANT